MGTFQLERAGEGALRFPRVERALEPSHGRHRRTGVVKHGGSLFIGAKRILVLRRERRENRIDSTAIARFERGLQ